MASEDAPQVSLELLEYLEQLYPNRVPDLKDNERMVWHKVGQVSVVQKLRWLYNQQTE